MAVNSYEFIECSLNAAEQERHATTIVNSAAIVKSQTVTYAVAIRK